MVPHGDILYHYVSQTGMCALTNRDREVINCTWSCVKIKSNLTNLMKYLEFRGIMVNMGRIHRELGKYLMISLNLIKSNNESMIEIGKNGIL